jgi:hypothetical protein
MQDKIPKDKREPGRSYGLGAEQAHKHVCHEIGERH